MSLFAVFRERLGTTHLEVDLPQGATVADLLEALRREHPGLGPLLAQTMVAVDQEYATPELVLQEGQQVALIPPVSGGS